ncbi:hypothetical protein BH11BAC4_BH11BAC4_10460 [soil metagenome]
MKRPLPFLIVLMAFGSHAQIVNIPDANFKLALAGDSDVVGSTIDTNGDGEIQYSEAAAFSQVGGGYILSINNKNIADLTGIPRAAQNLNFCIAPNGIHNDLDIKVNYIITFNGGTGVASITYQNKGTEALSGNVKFNFNDDKMDFVSALPDISSQSTGSLTWNFSNLQPLENRTLNIYLFTLLTPVNNINDTLNFSAVVNPIASDETPLDNIVAFRSVVTHSVLPVSMEYFKGAVQPGKHFVTWKANCTGTQAIFDIERSTDGRKFNSLQSITASNTRRLQPFDFMDATPVAGINYYRIKMTDTDGKASHSNVIALLNKKAGFEIVNLLPNPVTNGIALLNITSAEMQVINIKVCDAAGKIVQSSGQPIIAGFSQVNMNFNNFPSGLYNIILYTAHGERKTMQFIKQ